MIDKQKGCQLVVMNIKELEDLLGRLGNNDSHLIAEVRAMLMIKRANYRIVMENLHRITHPCLHPHESYE